MDDDTSLGARFWLMFILLCVGAVVAALVVALIFGRLWYAWGFFGLFLVLGAGLLAFGWAFDRRERKRRERLAA
jgi:Flp pilus assembly protein TadB